jgi:uncharacterized membrane protein (UPF0127 family)
VIEYLMRITNTTRGTVLAVAARKALGFIARGRGLMFTSALADGEGLVIEPCSSIHMFFMRYPLDVLFLDREGRVLFMYKGIKPWRVGRVVRGARTAVELPIESIERSGTQIGDQLALSAES